MRDLFWTRCYSTIILLGIDTAMYHINIIFAGSFSWDSAGIVKSKET